MSQRIGLGNTCGVADGLMPLLAVITWVMKTAGVWMLQSGDRSVLM